MSLHRSEVSGPQFLVPPGVENLVGRLQRELLPDTPPTKEWFDWQSFPLTNFYTGMALVRQKLGKGRHTFLDVGSGIGTKLFLADSLGFAPTGIERRADYIDVSRRLFERYAVYHTDALDFTGYHRFDVIYSYRLARHDALQTQVNEHILANMREDTIFFANDTQESLDRLPTDGVSAL